MQLVIDTNSTAFLLCVAPLFYIVAAYVTVTYVLPAYRANQRSTRRVHYSVETVGDDSDDDHTSQPDTPGKKEGLASISEGGGDVTSANDSNAQRGGASHRKKRGGGIKVSTESAPHHRARRPSSDITSSRKKINKDDLKIDTSHKPVNTPLAALMGRSTRSNSISALDNKAGIVLNKVVDSGVEQEIIDEGEIDYNRGSKQLRLTWDRKPKTVLLIKKWREPEITDSLAEIADWLKYERGMKVLVEPDVQENELPHLSTYRKGTSANLASRVDFVVVLGGDGTLLHLMSILPLSIPPVMSFSLGSMGFLTPFAASKFKTEIDNVIAGDFEITLRTRIACTVVEVTPGRRPDVVVAEHCVLNDFVIDRGPTTFLSSIDVFCDDEYVTTVQADGLIIATATGSSAYSLAAGGSIVHPSMPCILLTPICPHSLSFRPIIFPESATIKIRVNPHARNTAYLSFDGRNNRELTKTQLVICEISPWPVPTITKSSVTLDWIRSLSRCLYWNKRVQQKPLSTKKASKRRAQTVNSQPKSPFSASPPRRYAPSSYQNMTPGVHPIGEEGFPAAPADVIKRASELAADQLDDSSRLVVVIHSESESDEDAELSDAAGKAPVDAKSKRAQLDSANSDRSAKSGGGGDGSVDGGEEGDEGAWIFPRKSAPSPGSKRAAGGDGGVSGERLGALGFSQSDSSVGSKAKPPRGRSRGRSKSPGGKKLAGRQSLQPQPRTPRKSSLYENLPIE